jgi:mannosyltransferase OCH1-like enzyme
LSGDEYPPLIQYCIDTWHKVLPDYEIVLWNTNRFDINSVAWVKDAFELKKYAFAADYIRFYALYTEGGIYLDSDVEVLKSFNDLLMSKSFIGFEASTGNYEAAIVGAEPGMQWCKNILDFYEGKHFSLDIISSDILAPIVVEKGLRTVFGDDLPFESPKNPIVLNEGEIVVYPSEYFSPIKNDIEKSYSENKKTKKSYKKNKNTYCIHRFNASWTVRPSKKLQFWDWFKRALINLLGDKLAVKIINLIRRIVR